MGQDRSYTFDVFLCHNTRDKPAVEQIALRLRERNIRPWLDKWELRPGLPWQREIEQQLESVATAAVFFGPAGLGPWQEMEQEALLREFVDRECPVIPVILEGAEETPALPLFLSGMTWVDFRRKDLDPFEHLVWAITGRKTEQELVGLPHQPAAKSLPLSQPIRDFTGRTQELEELKRAIESGHSIVGIRGLAGIGKTELALKLVTELADEYPDARSTIDLNGTTAEPLPWHEAMRQILQPMLPGQQLPADSAALTMTYRGQMSGKRGVLLLDNVRDREQIEDVVPPESWLLIVTSRHHFTLPGMCAFDLDVLERSEARDLLLRISSRGSSDDPQGLEEILRLCGYLPLALRLAGRALAERPDWSFDELAKKLKDRTGRVQALGEVMASIELSRDLLDTEHQQRLVQLSILDAPFAAQSAAAIWNVSDDQTDSILGRLLGSGLLQWDAAVERYQLNNLVRDFAAETRTEEDAESAHVRHARYLLDLLADLNAQYLEGGEKVAQALADFDAIWPLVRSEFTWFASRQNNERAVHKVNEFPDAAPQLFDLRRDSHERIQWRKAALQAARQLGDRRREAKHLGNLGLAYAGLGEHKQAIKYLEQRVAIAQEIGDRHYEGRGLGNLGLQYAEIGDTKRAIKCQEQFLSIANEVGDRLGQGKALENLALVYAQLEDLPRSIDLHRQALEVSREIGDRRAEGEFLGNLAEVYSSQGETKLAIECYEKALQIDRELGVREREAGHCWFLGRALEQMNELPRAVQLIEQSVKIARELGDNNAQPHAEYLAELESRLGKSLCKDRSTETKPSDGACPVGTERLADELRKLVQDDEQQAAPNDPRPTALPAQDSKPAPGSDIVWVGRQEALDQLAAALAEVHQSQGAIVLLQGKSGIGKTAVVERFLDQHCRGPDTLVLQGKCYENVRTPFKGFDTLINTLAEHLAQLPREAVERVMPVDIRSLCHVFPKLAEVQLFSEALAPTATMGALDTRRRGFQSFRELLRRLARFSKLTLFIDDVHWGGRDTAEMFANVFRSPDAPQCLTLCTSREENADNEFLQTIRKEVEFDDTSLNWKELSIDRLTGEEARDLAAALLGNHATNELTRRIADQAEGHPLLARMLAEYSLRRIEQGNPLDDPPILEEAILSLVESLQPEQRQLVDLLAVSGCALDERWLMRAGGLDDSLALEELLAQRIVRVTQAKDARWIDLYHDKFRESIFSRIGTDQLAAYSRQLGDVLEAEGGDPALLAELFLRAGEGEKAGQYFCQAAQNALDSLAFHRAAELYQLAIQQLQPSGPREVELRRALGDSLSQSGHPAAAAEQYMTAAKTAEPADRLDLLCRGAHFLLTSGHVEAGLVNLKRVLAECDIRYPRRSVTAIASLLWHRLLLKWRGYRFDGSGQASDADRRRLQAYWAAAAGLSVINPLRAADFAARGLWHSLGYGDLTNVIRNLTAFSGHIAASGYRKRQQVDRLLDTIDDLAARDGGPYARAGAAIAHGVAAHLRSRYVDSVESCDRAVACLLDEESQSLDPRCCNATWEMDVAHSMTMWSLMYLGRIDELARRQPKLIRRAEETNNLFASLNFSTQVMTHMMLAADQPDEARRRLEADAERLPTFGFFVQHQNHLLALAFLEQYSGRGIQAWKHLENARQRYAKSILASVQHMRIDFLQAKGRAALAAAADADDARPYLRAVEVAANQLTKQDTPWALAHAQLLRAAHAATEREQHAAKEFERAAEAFDDCDGQLFAAAARVRAARLNATGYDEALEQMSSLGVRNPKCMSTALIPG